MLNHDNIYVILYSLPVYQLLFYTVQLVTFRRTSPSKRYFGFLMLTMTAFLVLNAMYRLGYNELFSQFYVIFTPVLLCIAPVFFLYVLSLTREDHDVRLNEKLLFLIPPFLILVLNIFTYCLLPAGTRLFFITQGLSSDPINTNEIKVAELSYWFGSIFIMAIQVVLVIFKVRKILLAEAAIMKRKPAYLAYLNWNWVMIISGSVLLFLITNGLANLMGPGRDLVQAVVYNSIMLLSGGMAGFYGMKQNSLLLQVSKMAMPAISVTAPETEAQMETAAEEKSVDFIKTEEAERISVDLVRLMEENKPFLSPDFSMGDLCTMLNESRRKVTYVINDYMNKNFYGIVNDYRIKEAVELLGKDKHANLKIEVIAEMVGFQSKSSFNACFKKYTGQTPSEYKNSLSNTKGTKG